MQFFTVNTLTAGYRKNPVIHNISFHLKEGSIMGILGANGCGKTTLLKSICGILPHEGNCMLEEKVLETLSPRQLSQLCSYIPQRSGILIDISALDVVLMGFNPHLNLWEHPSKAMKEKAKNALCLTGLAGKEEVNYLHLSEGQKQLCILARTLVTESRLLLLDEPESALDFHYRYHILDILYQWVHESNRGAIVTLHDPSLALNYCDTLLLLSEGKIAATLHPRTDSLETMEQAFQLIYGEISLQLLKNHSGQSCLVMLKENFH